MTTVDSTTASRSSPARPAARARPKRGCSSSGARRCSSPTSTTPPASALAADARRRTRSTATSTCAPRTSGSAALDAAVAAFGRVNALVNNAGISLPPKSIIKTSVDEYRQVIDVNQIGAFTGSMWSRPRSSPPAAAASSTSRRSTASSARGGSPGYASSKFALRGLTTRRRDRARAQGGAGQLDPPRPDRHADAARRDCRRAPIRSKAMARRRSPAGRVGTVEEVAAMVAFLLSDESSFCYGSEFVLDGGYLAGPLGSPQHRMKLSLLFPETRSLDPAARARGPHRGAGLPRHVARRRRSASTRSSRSRSPATPTNTIAARDRGRADLASPSAGDGPAGGDGQRGLRRPVPPRASDASHKPVMRMYGIDFDRPISHLREYLDDRAARCSTTAGSPHAGERYQVNGFLDVADAPPRPVLLGVLREQSARLAGSHADGALCWLCPAAYLHEVIAPNIAAGAAAADRPAPPLIAELPCALTSDRDAVHAMAAQRSRGLPARCRSTGRSSRPPASTSTDAEWSDEMIDASVLYGDEDGLGREDQCVLRCRCRRGRAVARSASATTSPGRRPTASECSATSPRSDRDGTEQRTTASREPSAVHAR